MANKPIIMPDGVGFGDETLSKYDEGTWTPTLSFGGATTGITYGAIRYGHYQRIGNRILFSCYFVLSSKGTATGAPLVSGLPTAASAENGGVVALEVWTSGVSRSNHRIQAYKEYGNGNIGLDCIPVNADASSVVSLTEANFSATASVMISGSYIAG